jgi:tRNA nucleotidyltransferase/poly(A) polymerase
LACALEFSIDPGTEAATKNFIREHRVELASVPGERYGKEFLKGFASRPYDFLTLLERYSLLPLALPEVEAMRGAEQHPAFHPEGDVLTHTFRVLAEAQRIIEKRPKGRRQDIELALAALFHDTGKPQSAQPHPKYGHICFFGHDELSERIALARLGTWALPGKIAPRVASLVRCHMIPGGNFAERTCVKLLRKLGADLAEVLFNLALCDARGSMAEGENILTARKLFHEVRNNLRRAEEASSRRWLDGHDVMKILAIPPGREVGKILEELDVAIGSGKLRSKEEAIQWLKNLRESRRPMRGIGEKDIEEEAAEQRGFLRILEMSPGEPLCGAKAVSGQTLEKT